LESGGNTQDEDAWTQRPERLMISRREKENLLNTDKVVVTMILV
jgi:hypothetical protein